MIDTASHIIIHNPKVWGLQTHTLTHIECIEITPLYTHIRFNRHSNPNGVLNYGIVYLLEPIYIKPSDSEMSLVLLKAYGISDTSHVYCLDKHEVYSYSLYFEPLPYNVNVIDIVEDKGCSFGFHNMSLVSLRKEHCRKYIQFFNN